MGLRAARTNALLGLGLAAIWGVGGSVVIRWCFGPKFAPAYLPLLGLLPGMVFLGMQRVCGGPALRSGKPGRITAIYAGSLLANGLLNLWWIPTLGPLGAALASSVSYGLGALCFLAWTAQLAGAPLSEAVVPRWSDVLALREVTVRVIRLLKQAAASYTGAP